MEKLVSGYDLKGDLNQIVVLHLSGYIDVSSSQQLEDIIEKFLQKQYLFFIFDLTHIDFIASAGWSSIISALKKVRKVGGDIKLIKMSDEIKDVFALLEFDKIIHYYEDEEEAIASFIEGEEKHPPSPITFENKDLVDDLTDMAYMNLENKIKRIIDTYPDISYKEIKKILNTPPYGNEKISLLRIISIVKKVRKEK